MANFPNNVPLSVYVHIPWCVQKCPYCDFNSHESKDSLPEMLYLAALQDELHHFLPLAANRPIKSIFFGGGTPSLFTGQTIGRILAMLNQHLTLSDQIEITLEANPGTIDYPRFQDFRLAGINRLSLGVQSLQNDKLKALGRIHDRSHAIKAIDALQRAGFDNFNIDIMHGLPNQTITDALSDLETVLAFHPPHLSWYQLTIEPNTFFHHQPPRLPPEKRLLEIQKQGQEYILAAGLNHYEVSAYAKPGRECRHNRNYWEYGDYLGLGAGAHSKLTDTQTGAIYRYAQVKHPKDYLNGDKRRQIQGQKVEAADLIFEFMLNALRLTQGIPVTLFSAHTGLPISLIEKKIQLAQEKGLLIKNPTLLKPTEMGQRFLNDLVGLFLPN